MTGPDALALSPYATARPPPPTDPTGPTLIFPGTAWTAFVQAVREEAR
ncbi:MULTISPECIES: DUF397 domain-containing protein [unclassified Streptomyces]